MLCLKCFLCRNIARSIHASSRHTSHAADANKTLYIAVLGAPNVGKSSLVNYMVGARVSAVTDKQHTTRRSVNGILNIGSTQLVFTDTPGIVHYSDARRLKMHRDQKVTPARTAFVADIIAVLADASDRCHQRFIPDCVLDIVQQNQHIPSVLVLNKVDCVSNRNNLLAYAHVLNIDKLKDENGVEIGGWSGFKETHYVSALRGHGVKLLLDYFLSVAKPGEWEYGYKVYSDSSYEEIISDVFRERLILMYGREIPWQCKQETTVFDVSSIQRTIKIVHQLEFPKSYQCNLVLRKHAELTTSAERLLSDMLECNIKLTVKIQLYKGTMRKDMAHYS